jgi:hypothetical protein
MRCVVQSFCALSLLLVAVFAFAKDKNAVAVPMSNLHFLVVKDDNNKPVRNASVILHLVTKDGQQEKGGFQLKTDNEGITETEGIPYGLIRIQVLAPGMQSYGDDYHIDKPQMDIEIRLKRPTDQMSVYDQPKKKEPPAPTTPQAEPKPN